MRMYLMQCISVIVEIVEQGYMAVKLFICIKMCYYSCIAVQKYNWQASYVYVRCL